jgi:hypothetical protein
MWWKRKPTAAKSTHNAADNIFTKINERLNSNTDELPELLSQIQSIAPSLKAQDAKKGISAIIACMRKNPKVCLTQVEGCLALSSIIYDKQTGVARPTMTEVEWSEIVLHMYYQSVLGTLLEALSLLVQNRVTLSAQKLEEAQQACYWMLLTIFTKTRDPSLTRSPVPVPLLTAVISSMATHVQNPLLTRGAMRVIETAILCNRVNAEILSINGAKLVLEGMSTHADIADMQETGFETLRAMCYHFPSIRTCLCAQLGCVPFTIRMMKKHVQSAATGCSACKFLTCMMNRDNDEEMRLRFIQNGGVDAVLTTMREHTNVIETTSAGCEALARFNRTQNKQHVESWVSEGMYDVALAAVVRFPADRVIQDTGAVVISRGLQETADQSSEQLTRLRRLAIPALIALIATLSSRPHVPLVQCAMSGLRACSTLDTYASDIHTHRGIEVIVRAMQALVTDSMIQRSALVIIAVVARQHAGNQESCRESGAIEAIIRAVTIYEMYEDILVMANEALTAICTSHEHNTACVKRLLPPNYAEKMMKLKKQGRGGGGVGDAEHGVESMPGNAHANVSVSGVARGSDVVVVEAAGGTKT